MTIVVRADGELWAAADAVVHATVVSSQPLLHDNGRVFTHVHLLIHEVWKGALDGTELELVEMGGAAEGIADWVPGVPSYADGETVVCFIVQRPEGSWSTLDAWSGRFRVEETAAGRAVLLRDQATAAVKLYGPGFKPFTDRVRDFDRFRSWAVARAQGTDTDADYRVSDADIVREGGLVKAVHAPEVNLKWGLLSFHGRWAEYDSGAAVSWWYGNDPQIGFTAGSTSGNGPQELGRALATWTDDPSSSVVMSDSGAHSPYGSGWAGGGDGYSEVLFNDPHNEIDGDFDCSSGGVLGFGGIHQVLGNHSFRGSTWYTATEGDVVMQSWTQDCSWLDSEDLTEILQHELGHALGLGHSYDNGETGNQLTDDALMRWMAHGGSLADVLGEDDRCAIYWLYPKSRVDLELSPSSTVTTAPATVAPDAFATIQVVLDDGSGGLPGQIVRGWIESTTGSASGALSRGNPYPDLPFTDNGDGTYEAVLDVGSGTGTLEVHVTVNCCDDAVPAPTYPCDDFTETATVTVATGPILGDANGDGQVDGEDLALIVQEIFDGDGLTASEQCNEAPCPEPEADGDGNGFIDTGDLSVALTKAS